MEQNLPPDKRSIRDLLSESKLLSDQADKIRQRMDELTGEIARRAADAEIRKSKSLTPLPWELEPKSPSN